MLWVVLPHEGFLAKVTYRLDHGRRCSRLRVGLTLIGISDIGVAEDMPERQPYHPPIAEPQRVPHEGGNGAPGLPRTVHESANPPPLEKRERQPTPDIWEFLHRRERYFGDIKAGIRARDEELFGGESFKLFVLRDTIIHEGTVRDNLILKLYDAKIKLEGVNPEYILDRNTPHWNPHPSLSSPEELQQFRSQVEQMSDEKITEAIRKQEKKNRREWLATVSPEEKRRERSWRYRQKLKEKRRLQAEQQPTQVFPPPTKG